MATLPAALHTSGQCGYGHDDATNEIDDGEKEWGKEELNWAELKKHY